MAIIDSASGAHAALLSKLAACGAELRSLGGEIGDGGHPLRVIDQLQHADRVEARVLQDIDVLFAPQLGLQPLAVLGRIAKRSPLLAVWSGCLTGGRLTYSRPGRPDHFDAPARDLVVLRPLTTNFPDEVPYAIERYPA